MLNHNPYDYDNPVVRPDMFFGREEQLTRVIKGLTASVPKSFAVFGGRRFGKTSMLHAIENRLGILNRSKEAEPTQFVPIYLDMHRETIADRSEFIARVLRAFAEQAMILNTGLVTLDKDYVHSLLRQPEFGREPVVAFESGFTYIRNALHKCGFEARVILLVDESERLLNQFYSADLLSNLRSLLSNMPNVTGALRMVMAGSTDFTFATEKGSPLANILNIEYLQPLSREATFDLIQVPTEYALNDVIAHCIYKQTGGHACLTQYLMSHLCDRGIDGSTTDLVLELAQQFSDSKVVFDEWLEDLGPTAESIYSILALVSKGLSTPSIADRISRSPAEVRKALIALSYHGLVIRTEQKKWLTNGLMFRQWFCDAVGLSDRNMSIRGQTSSKGLSEDAEFRAPSTLSAPRNGTRQQYPQTITWLHLSDLHFHKSHTYDESIVAKALLRDVDQRIHEDGLQPDFVIVSGDIASASCPEEYELARQFLDGLANTTCLAKNRLFLVPGNHDVDRIAISPLAAGAIAILNSRDTVNRLLDSDADCALVFQRFHNYEHFVNEYLDYDSPYADSARCFYVKKIQVAGQRVAILGLNSAWLSASDEDRNRLLLGERQVRAALDETEDADLRLAVLHHPFDWLQDFDRKDVEPILCSGCDFVLHGHMHQIGLLRASTPDAEAMIIAAGACYETRQYPNSYSFVHLNLNACTGTVYLRMYSDRQGGFWTKDVVNYRDVDDGVYTFPLPDHLCRSGIVHK